MHPPIDPHDAGMLEVGEDNRLYWEVCGNAHGTPALVLHGGPGSGCTPRHRQLFDPEAYRVILFDQRQCGRSTPHARDPTTSLATNTTQHLLSDVELLREHFGVERWLVYGNSWGSTLALAYAEEHPDRVSAMILAAVTMTRPAEIDWLYHGAGRFYPEEWQRFRDGVPPAERDGNLVAAYCRLLARGDIGAARRWCDWEETVAGVGPQARYEDPSFRMAFARIVTRYFSNQAWLEDGILLHRADRLRGIPGELIHGRMDIGSPLVTAWELAQRWPDADLVVVDEDGHSGDTITARVLDATDRFRLVH